MPSQLRSAYARAEDWREAVDACLRQIGDCEGANLGFVYFSDYFVDAAQDLLHRLRSATGVVNWVGTVAHGVCGAGQASTDEAALALLVGHFPESSFHVFSGREPLRSAEGEHYFAVVHADPNTPDMSELVADMAGKVTSGFITGGLSSGRGPTVQIANGVLSGGISGVAFSPAVGVATRLTQGCLPLPGVFRITECEDNIVSRLDRRPALQVYVEAVGADFAQDLRRAAATVLVGLPVRGRETGDYLVRHVVGIDPQNGLLAINEKVEPGQSLLFCRRDGDAAQQDMRRMLDTLRESLTAPPRGGLYVCCTARGSGMFDNDNVEMQMIRDTLGDIPIAGFFAAGEIAHDRLYGYTGVLTLFT